VKIEIIELKRKIKYSRSYSDNNNMHDWPSSDI
jgi:hypothetical protein